jgi:glycosyltransferase involved in cell wall biosynthesis
MTPGDGGPDRTRLQIALVHYATPPVVGGVERVVARHAVLLADAGHAVRVVVGRGRAPDPRIRLVRVPLVDPRHPTIERLQRELDAGRVPREFGGVVVELANRIGDALRGSDVVVAHNVCSLNLNLALTAALRDLAARADGTRLILWHHDLAWASARYRAALHAGTPWDLLRTAWPGATQVVVSERRRAELAALAGIRPATIAVVPNGVDVAGMWKLDRATSALLSRTDLLAVSPLLLMPTRITPRKNVELGLHVVAELRAVGRPAGLVVTGPADPHRGSGREYLERLRALRRTLGLDEVVWFLSDAPGGPPSDAMMDDLYHLADILFLPSRDEGFGLPILEAAVDRLPIVCAELPALREIAGEAATYIEPDDEPVWIARMILERLDADPLGRFAREIRSNYSWEAVYRERIAPLLAPA